MPDEIENQIYTVSELTKEIKLTLEESYAKISVVGEISNFKSHISGHWYFNLKDSDAVISCTMWKGLNSFVFFTPQDGMKVIVNGKLTVYPPRGNYQIDVRSMKPAGLGELQEAYERLKQKLEAEGLFDEDHKKEIPSFPQKIGIVTAISGAALKDMISVAERRFPATEFVIAPALMQGSGSSESIVQSLELLNQRDDIDVIIVARGGGSIEDLWSLNEEIVARAIYKSKVPVISGVGHEVDFTIADYVADLRAPTPSVAMELATPDITKLYSFISEFLRYTFDLIINLIDDAYIKIGTFTDSYAFRYPMDLIRKSQQKIDFLLGAINQKIDGKLLVYNRNISLFTKTLQTMDIEQTLRRGFVLVRQNSKFITKAKDFNNEESADLQFSDGRIKVNT